MCSNIPICIEIMKKEGASIQAIQEKTFKILPYTLEKYNFLQNVVTEEFLNLQHNLIMKQPRMTVVEIGNRMSKNTEKVLEMMQGQGRYIYVDEYSKNLELARRKFGKYKNFDVCEYDFKQTGLYQENLYKKADLIILDNVLHRALDIDKTLINIRRMLKPDGKLVIREYTKNNILMLCTVVFLEENYSGILDERRYQGTPLLNAEKWSEKLLDSGFKNVSVATVDVEDYEGVGDSIILATNSGMVENISMNKVLEQLQNELPAYMIPRKTYFLEKFPLTENGKINKQALMAEIQLPKVSNRNIELLNNDLTDIEKKVLDILSNLLGFRKISKESSFFELGGDSLKAIKFVNGIREEFNIEYNLGDLFEDPYIKDIAMIVEEKKSSIFVEEEGII